MLCWCRAQIDAQCFVYRHTTPLHPVWSSVWGFFGTPKCYGKAHNPAQSSATLDNLSQPWATDTRSIAPLTSTTLGDAPQRPEGGGLFEF